MDAGSGAQPGRRRLPGRHGHDQGAAEEHGSRSDPGRQPRAGQSLDRHAPDRRAHGEGRTTASEGRMNDIVRREDPGHIGKGAWVIERDGKTLAELSYTTAGSRVI